MEERDNILKEITDLRKKLLELNDEDTDKNGFLRVFLSSLILPVAFFIFESFFHLETNKVIAIFLLLFFISLLFFSILEKKRVERKSREIEVEKIKIQADIFTKARELEEINNKDKDN